MTESQAHVRVATTQALGGLGGILLFVTALAAFVIQSSLTQYVQGTLGYRQPFFLVYLAHSSFLIIFPIHLLYLAITSRRPLHTYVYSLKSALASRLLPLGNTPLEKGKFPTARFVGMVFAFATGINVPGALWYAAVSLASIGDVTALWNTNSFWVYVLTVKLYHMKWQPWKLGAVVLACCGVILDVYGGSKFTQTPEGTTARATDLTVHNEGPTAPVLGDAMTLVASVSYALYQVLYKRYAALPNDDEGNDEQDRASFSYESLSEASSSTLSIAPRARVPSDDEHMALPFGLYSNFFTSSMGLCTFLTFWIALPIFHWLSIERFALPPDAWVFGCVIAIASAGVVFNSCYMILLGLWGPVLTSVGNLLSIVLVLVTDFFFNNGSITIWSLTGSGMIVAAFGVLVADMAHHSK